MERKMVKFMQEQYPPGTRIRLNFMNDPYDFSEAVDDLAENVEEVQDTIDDMDEDDPSIEVNNNIEDHLIAECERCHGIFISAILQSDMEIDHVTGTCPLCGRESNQYLKWVVKPAKPRV